MGNMWNSDPRGWRLSRRGFMRDGPRSPATAALSSTFAGRNAGAQENTLTYLSWPGHADPFIVEPFEQEHGVKIVGKEYVGGEQMLALVNQSPPGTYDVILSDREYIVQLRDAGFIDKMNPADYPFDDFWPEFQNLEGHWLEGDLYSVMVDFGYLGLVHNTDHPQRSRLQQLRRDVGRQGEGQGRPLRLVPADHGLPQPLQRQQGPVQHRRRGVRQAAGHHLLAGAAACRLLRHGPTCSPR